MLYRFLLLFLLIASISLISSGASAGDPLKVDVPDVGNGPVSKKEAGRLNVDIANPRGETVVFLGVSVEKKGGDGKFRNFRTNIACGCNVRCKQSSYVLKKGEDMRVTWDFLAGDCQESPAGIYRVAVIERYSDVLSGYVYYGASKEFEVAK